MRVSDGRLSAALFVAATLCCALVTKSHADSWNDRSRFATIESLTDRHTFAIDGSPFTAAMRDEYGYGGHIYSDKPPLLALEGFGMAATLARFGLTFARTPGTVVYLVTLAVIGGWFARGVTYAFALQRALGFGRSVAVGVAALTGLGTLALPYATVFSNHVPAGVAALASLFHARRAAGAISDAILAGLFAMLAVACDAGALPFALGTAVLLWGARPATIAWACAGALPLAIAQLAFNHAVSGGFGPPALNPSSWADPSSPFHNDYTALGRFPDIASYARYALYLLAGDKGLFSYSPLLLAALGGLVIWFRQGTGDERRLALAIALPSVVYIALIVLYTDDFTSYTYGDRRFAELAFVGCVPLGAALTAARRDARARAAILALGGASIALAGLGTFAPFAGPEGISAAWNVFVALFRRSPALGTLDALGVVAAVALGSRASLRAMRTVAERPAAAGESLYTH